MKKRSFFFSAGLLSCMLLMVSCYRNPATTVSLLSSRSDSQAKPIRIAFLTNMQGGEHWGNMKSGARFARSMHENMTIEFYAPVNEADYQGQSTMVMNAVEGRFDAIVISPSHATYASPAIQQALTQGIAVVTVDNDILAPSGASLAHSHVGTNPQEVGEETALKAMELAPRARRALIVASVPESTTMTGKVTAITEVLSGEGIAVQVIFCHADANASYQQVKEILETGGTVDIIIALEEYASHGAADALDEMEGADGIIFIGSGNSRYQLNLLEIGQMDALVVENSFTMGYLAVEAAAALVNGQAVTPSAVEFVIVTPETMRDEHYQRLLFPLTN